MVHVAKIMAGVAVDALNDPALIEAAQADLLARTAENPYVCPLPDDLQPPIHMGKK
jgi:aminobenzoyl-glutamate utilization protein B